MVKLTEVKMFQKTGNCKGGQGESSTVDIRSSDSHGGRTELHAAAIRGDAISLKYLIEAAREEDSLVETKDNDGNTVLHWAVKKKRVDMVELLLKFHFRLCSLPNRKKETPLCMAVRLGCFEIVELLIDRSYLLQKSIAVGEYKTLLEKADNDGNTVLHWAVKKNRVDMVELLLKFHTGFCNSQNNKKETPLCMAVKFGFLNIVQMLIKCRPDSIEILSENGKNVLHLAVELRRYEIVKFLTETEKATISQLINQPTDTEEDLWQSDDEPHAAFEGTRICKETKDNEPSKERKDRKPNFLQGGQNTPLHIAANDKNLDMVELLLKVHGVDKDAVNKAGLTPLDIAREITEYHESFSIIEKLVDFPERSRPFLYSTPTVSPEKHERAQKVLREVFNERRNTELIVAVLLAAIAFTAALQVPGSFHQEDDDKTPESHKALGSLILIGYLSFKLFLVFDCVAFFLSLFVALLWTISSKLATDDLMLFMTISGTVICIAFAFTAYAFMLGVYAVVGHKVPTLAKVILGFSITTNVVGNLAYFYVLAKVLVRQARFHRLCGVPRWLDNMVEKIWTRAEKRGLLDILRRLHDRCRRRLLTDDNKEAPKKG